MSNGLLVSGDSKILITGSNTYAILNLEGRNLSLYTHGALIGNNLYIFADNLSKARWYGFAQDSGEIILVNSSNPSYTITYYTASRKAPIGAFAASTEIGVRPIVIDEDNFAYIFTAGSPYWLEIGPIAHDGALASLPYMSIELGSPIIVERSNGQWASSEKALLQVVAGSLKYTGDIYFTLYYYDRNELQDLPATSGVVTQNETTIESYAYFYVSDTNGLAVRFYSFAAGGPLYTLTNIPVGNYTLTIIYQKIYKNSTTHQIISIDWYTAQTSISVYPLLNTSIGTQRALFLESGDYTPEDVASQLGIYVPVNDVIQEYVALNLTKLNETSIYQFPSKGSALWLTYLPVPVDAGGIDAFWIYKPSTKPLTWPSNAEYLMIASTQNNFALLYLLDRNLTPIAFNGPGGFYEMIYLGAHISTSPSVTPNLDQVYLGVESGYLVQLVWLDAQRRYVAANAYVLDVGPVSSIQYLISGKIVASSINGLMQLIDTATWKPLWRGIPGYAGIDTKMLGLVLSSGGAQDYILALAPGEGSISVMYGLGTPLYPLMLQGVIPFHQLSGDTNVTGFPNGSAALVLDGGVPVAYDMFSKNSTATFYLPAGTHTVNITLPGLGSLEKTYEIENGVSDTIVVGLREVEVNAYTPASIGDPKKDPGYYLVHGPKPGTQVSAEVFGYDPDLGYVPSPLPLQATTMANGTAVLVIWEGVMYQVQGSLPGYTSATILTDIYGTERLNLTMHPVLNKVSFNIYDNETASYGTPLYLSATVSLFYQETGRNITLPITGQGDYYYLPRGTYLLQATSPHYYPAQQTVVISGPATVDVGLEPQRYNLEIDVYQVDTTGLGIANGPLSGASVNITMVWPVSGMIKLTVYTGSDGKALVNLRYGIYRVTITHPYTESSIASVYLGNNTVRTVSLDLKQSLLTLYFKDSQFTLYGITNVTVTFTYQGSTWTANYTLQTGNKSIVTVTLPYGVYTLRAQAKYYQTYVESIEIARDSMLKTAYMDPAMATVRVQVAYSPFAGNLTQGPVQGALVQLKLVRPSIPTENITAVTGPDGIATFYVRQGVYTITVTSKYTLPQTDSGIEIIGDALIAEPVTPGTTNVSITTVDAESSALVPGVELAITRIGPGVEKTFAITLSNGTSSLTLPAGRYTIKASYPGRYYEQEYSLDLATGTSSHITFSLQPVKGGLSISLASSPSQAIIGGERIDLPSTPIVGANVTLIPLDDLLRAVYNKTLTTRTAQDGMASLTPLRTGMYRLVIAKPGYPVYVVNVTVSPEAVTSLTITLDPMLASVNITVIDNGLADKYVKNYSLSLIYYNNQKINKTIILPGLTQAKLPIGTYTILIEKDRYLPSNITINVSSSNALSIDIPLTPIIVNTTATLTITGIDWATGEVQSGTLLLIAKDWNLASPAIKTSVEGGISTLSLRIGTYDVYLLLPSMGANISLGQIQISGETPQISLEVEPPTYTINFNIKDSDLITKIYGRASIQLSYQGPFGTGSLSATVDNGSITLSLIPGNYTILVTSDYYQDYQDNIFITGTANETIILVPVRVQTTINLVDIDGNPVSAPNTTVTFVHKETGETLGGYLIEGKIIPLKGLRLGTYEVTIIPPDDATINVTRVLITVSQAGPTPATITAPPKLYTLTIILYDPVMGKPAATEFTIEIQRSGNPASEYGLPIRAKTSNGTLKALVPYGVYTIAATPGPNSVFQAPPAETVMVSGDTAVNITLTPLTFTGIVQVVDDRGVPLKNAIVIVTNMKGQVVASGATDTTGQFAFKSVYGPYTVTVTAKGYKTGVGSLYLPTQNQASVKLNPTPATIVKRYSILIVGIIGLAGVASILYLARGKIMQRLAEEEEYF